MRNKINKLLVYALFLLLTINNVVFARAGGHSSHSSSHSSFSGGHSFSGGSSSSSIQLPFWVDILIIIGFFLYIIYVLYCFITAKPVNYIEDNTIIQNQADNNSNEKLDALKQRDFAFNEDNLKMKAQEMYKTIQDAWMNKTWENIRPFETDALFIAHSKQLQFLKDNNLTNHIENLEFKNLEIISCFEDGPYDVLKVAIVTIAKDYITLGEKPLGEIRLVPSTEIWTLIRKKGVISGRDSKKVTQCPNCGAELSISTEGICEYCKSKVSAGLHDWVLASIES